MCRLLFRKNIKMYILSRPFVILLGIGYTRHMSLISLDMVTHNVLQSTERV